jgi:hypothetical protein
MERVASKIAIIFIQSMTGFGSEGEFGGCMEIIFCSKPAAQHYVDILYSSQIK